MKLDINKELKQIHVRIDEFKLKSHGRKAIGELLLRIHLYRCTANVEAAREYFGGLTAINDDWLEIKDIVAAQKPKRVMIVQGNTILEGDVVHLKEYEKTAQGMLESWADRSAMLNL